MKRLLDLLRPKRSNLANVAKERLNIVISHERKSPSSLDFVPLLHKDILQLVGKYVTIKEDQISLSINRKGDAEVMEINVALPENYSQFSAPSKPPLARP